MNKLKLLGYSLVLLSFIGCSDSDSDSSPKVVVDEITLVNPITGIFVDSAVAGIDYVCSSGNSGVTNTLGEFTCEAGDTVSFSLAGNSLGEVSVDDYTSPNYLTPLSLFNGDEEAATNFAQLAQTLDSDGNPSNGIDINQTQAQAIGDEINFYSPDFDKEVQTLLGDDVNLTNEDDANKHLNETFAILDINDGGTYPRDPAYTWLESEWGNCEGECGTDNATKTREVICQEDANVTVEDNMCTEEKPTTTLSCTASECVVIPVRPPVVVNQAPVFTSDANVSVKENNATAITLVATDADNDDINYTISGGDFASFDINTTTGVVTFNINPLPDYESNKRNYLFTAKATDEKNNSSTQDVNISIIDDSTDREHYHNGFKYGEVDSTEGTGKVWLDRNLGASRVCTSGTDVLCYGDLYQWGRNADGHQLITSTAIDVNNSNPTTDITNVGHGNFLKTIGNDWTGGTDANLLLRQEAWSKTDGSSICPVGFRVPTRTELSAEVTEGAVTVGAGFNTFLKLSATGYRIPNAILANQGNNGYFWTSDPLGGIFVRNLIIEHYSVYINYEAIGFGHAVRCIKD